MKILFLILSLFSLSLSLSLSLYLSLSVVISGAFLKNLLHNYIINIKKKSFSGEAKDSVIFHLFFLLHKRAKPILPPCVHFSNHKLIITLCSPLVKITSYLIFILRYSPPLCPFLISKSVINFCKPAQPEKNVINFCNPPCLYKSLILPPVP
jgi:hypothetical protein